MNVIASTGTPTATPDTAADVHAAAKPATGGLSARPFNFSVMLAEFLAAMQKLRNAVKEAEAQGVLSQWKLQKSSLDAQADFIKKTFDAAVVSGAWEIVGGVATGITAFGGFRKAGPMGLEIGSQIGSGIFSPLSNAGSRITGGALTKEAADAQMRADFTKGCSEAHGHLIGTLGEEGAAIRQDYLSGMRTMWQAQQDILKAIDISR